jgi:hypothetical protein
MTDPQYNDDDVVYVDPDTKTVIGKVEYDNDGKPKSLKYDKKGEGTQAWRKFYPFGTYKSMKRTFRLEGKRSSEEDEESSFDTALSKLLNDSN